MRLPEQESGEFQVRKISKGTNSQHNNSKESCFQRNNHAYLQAIVLTWIHLEPYKILLRLSNKPIEFAHIIPPLDKVSAVESKFGMQALGSPLSYQLTPVELNFEVRCLFDGKLPSKSHHHTPLNILQICQYVYLYHQKKVITALMKNS